jgi:two-component system OmpR family response regulator
MSVPELSRILYVEDDPDIRTVTLLSLELVGGFEVLACSNGPDAVSRGAGFSPQLLLLDVMMPEMDGPETLKRLRGQPPLARCPAVFFTAKVQPSEVERLLSLGAAAVIAKPFDPEKLADQIRNVWNDCHDG